jgi:hypothetical protein
VSIRYELKPLDAEAVSAYIAHRLTIAGGSASVAFAPKALREVHRRSGGIPRLINLICDRALLTAYSIRANRVTRDMVTHAAASLDVQEPQARAIRWLRPRASLFVAAALVLLASALSVVATSFVYRRFDAGLIAASRSAALREPQGTPSDRNLAETRGESLALHPSESAGSGRVPGTRAFRASDEPHVSVTHRLPADAAFTILVGSYPIGEPTTAADVAALTDWLESSGFAVFYADVDLGSRGRWQRILAGAYTDSESARRDADRLKIAAPQSDARLVSAGFATGIVATVSHEAGAAARHSGTEP